VADNDCGVPCFLGFRDLRLGGDLLMQQARLAAVLFIAVLLAVLVVRVSGYIQMQQDVACTTTFMAYGGETQEQFQRVVELRQEWC
jgi:hypothetical protein